MTSTEVEEAPGSRRFRELIRRERQDMAWLVHVVAAMYDEVSGGRISKPMTYPEHVVAAFNDRLSEVEADLEARLVAALAEMAHEAPNAKVDPGDYMGGLPTVREFAVELAATLRGVPRS